MDKPPFPADQIHIACARPLSMAQPSRFMENEDREGGGCRVGGCPEAALPGSKDEWRP
jgi:hypothetical protein